MTIALTNTRTVEHNFTLDQQSVSKDVEPGENAVGDPRCPAQGR